MRVICKTRGSGLHCHGCRHVAEACRSDALEKPALADLSDGLLVCLDCNTPDVQALLSSSTTDIGPFFDRYGQLKSKIGLTHICSGCLYTKTGIDWRRKARSPV